MSQSGRAAHARNKARHAQREFGEVKPRLVSQEEGTRWMGGFIESIQGHTEPFGADSDVALPLGPTTEARTLRLRELAKLGVLQMSAPRENGVFLGYRWQLTQAGTLPRA